MMGKTCVFMQLMFVLKCFEAFKKEFRLKELKLIVMCQCKHCMTGSKNSSQNEITWQYQSRFESNIAIPVLSRIAANLKRTFWQCFSINMLFGSTFFTGLPESCILKYSGSVVWGFEKLIICSYNIVIQEGPQYKHFVAIAGKKCWLVNIKPDFFNPQNRMH